MKRDIIKLVDIYKIYETGESKVYALQGVSLSVGEGEFISIMGPSGSGKSTMMNLIGCLDKPSKGEIFLDGYNIAHLHESDLAQIRGRKIGFVFQSFNLIPTLNVKENILLPSIFQGIQKSIQEEKVKQLLELVELSNREFHYPNQLSGGQQQRVAIARALINDPEVILADEPTGNLDSKTGYKILDFLEKLHKQGKTIIMITHERDLAEKYSQKIYWLRDGKIEKVTRGKRS